MADTETILAFHRSLYLPDAVKAAAEAYSAYAQEIAIDEGEIELVVAIRGYDPGYGEMLGDSFANHALFETVVRSRETLGGVTL